MMTVRPAPPERRLLDFCVQEYLRRGEMLEANLYAWLRFEQRPDYDPRR